MGGKNKHKKKYQQRSSNNSNYAPKLSEEQLCELVAQCTQIQPFLNQRQQRLREAKQFAYLLSTKWLRQWKEYVGYQSLFKQNSSSHDTKMGRKVPSQINSDLIASNKDFYEVPEDCQQYEYLNTVVNEKYDIDDEFIAVDKETWDKFSTYYEGKQIKRPLRKQKSGKVYVDGSLFNCDVIFINYEENLEEKIQKMKNIRKNIEELIPCNKMQFSIIWELSDLEQYIKNYCNVNFGGNPTAIWKAHNFIGSLSLLEMFAKGVKEQTYEIYGTKLDKTYEDLDIDEFLKKEYALVVEVHGQKIKPAKIPKDLNGYCESCIQKRKLDYICDCREMFYCSAQCRCDDQTWHYKVCSKAFDSSDDEEYEDKKKPGVSLCGLKNLGNTCYMNSSIQLALSIEPLKNYLLGNKFLQQNQKEEEESEDKQNQMFLRKLSKFWKQTVDTKPELTIAPWGLKSQVNYFLSQFSGYKQHDSDDFLVSFLNTINECLPKEKQSAYHPLIQQNFMGQFNSLVICPDCGTEVSNDEDFLQLTVPIKAKGKKQYYNYGVVMTPYATTYGRAEVLGSWEDIFKNVGVPQNCILLGGNESGQSIIEINIENSPENVLKKMKKDLLFYPNEKMQQNQVRFNTGFISLKSMCGQTMKSNYGYPFLTIVDKEKTVAELFLSIMDKLCQTQDIEVFKKYFEQRMNERQKIAKQKEQKIKKSKEQKSQKQGKKQQETQETQKTEINQQKQENNIQDELRDELIALMKKVKIQIYVEDQKRQKNICYYCSKKCSLCQLSPSFQTVQEYFSHKIPQTKLQIYFSDKPELVKIQKDLSTNGDSTIEDCLQLFKQPEQLDEQNAWYCYKCEDMRLAYKQLKIKKLPQILIIHLNRFKSDGAGKVKNTEPISYNEYEFFGNIKYRLIGVVVHEGSMEGGHYWSICLRENDYYIFNDSKVNKTNKLCNKNAYIISYKRVQQK